MEPTRADLSAIDPPTFGAPDIQSRRWVAHDASRLRYGMFIGSNYTIVGQNELQYWQAWALFWSELASEAMWKVEKGARTKDQTGRRLSDDRSHLSQAEDKVVQGERRIEEVITPGNFAGR